MAIPTIPSSMVGIYVLFVQFFWKKKKNRIVNDIVTLFYFFITIYVINYN